MNCAASLAFVLGNGVAFSYGYHEMCEVKSMLRGAARLLTLIFTEVILFVSIFIFQGSGIFGHLIDLILQLLFLAIYRLKFHPLAKYPGPVLARITDLYSVYHCWLGDNHLKFYSLHCEYG